MLTLEYFLINVYIVTYFAPSPPKWLLCQHTRWAGIFVLLIELVTLPITYVYPDSAWGICICATAHLLFLGTIAKLGRDGVERNIYTTLGITTPAVTLWSYVALLNNNWLILSFILILIIVSGLTTGRILLWIIRNRKQVTRAIEWVFSLLFLGLFTSDFFMCLLILLPIYIRSPIEGSQLQYEAVMLHLVFIGLAIVGRCISLLTKLTNKNKFSSSLILSTFFIIIFSTIFLEQIFSRILVPEANFMGVLKIFWTFTF